MAGQLNISNKILSLRDRMLVTDETNRVVYEAAGDFTFFRTTWRIYKGTAQVAVIQRKIFSWLPTWKITGTGGDFTIRKKFFALTRSYKIIGGLFNGSIIRGNMLGFSFEIFRRGSLVARASENILTLRDTYAIDVISDDPDDELLTVIAIVTLRLDKRAEEKSREAQQDHRR